MIRRFNDWWSRPFVPNNGARFCSGCVAISIAVAFWTISVRLNRLEKESVTVSRQLSTTRIQIRLLNNENRLLHQNIAFEARARRALQERVAGFPAANIADRRFRTTAKRVYYPLGGYGL